MAAKVLVNTPATAVTDALDGLLLTHPHLKRLDGFPGTKVVVDPAARRNRHVAILSGGGAGHEPAHAGLVGAGLLSAAISGDVFASPHVNAILAGVRYAATATVTPAAAGEEEGGAAAKKGCLLVVKNYTGDRLAFGLAAERARAEGIPCELCFVADDAAVEGGAATGRRGIAGTVFVHKIAAAVAATGETLANVAAAARAASARVVSIGASLTVCDIPGVPPSDRLSATGAAAGGDGTATGGPAAMEIGLGIHGEPGAQRLSSVLTSDALAHRLLQALAERLVAGGIVPLLPPSTTAITLPVAMLVNNLGGLSNLEMAVFTKSAVAAADQAKAKGGFAVAAPTGSAAVRVAFVVQRLAVGPVMTSLDMRGVSISLLPLGDLAIPGGAGPLPVLPLLDAPTSCAAWPVWTAARDPAAGITLADVGVEPLPAPPAVGAAAAAASTGSAAATTADDLAFAVAVQRCIAAASDAVTGAVDRLNELDRVCGDGDCGTTAGLMAAGVKAAVADVDALLAATKRGGRAGVFEAALSACATAVGEVAGGTSGVLYALMLQAAANAVAGVAAQDAPAPLLASTALSAAVAALEHYAMSAAGLRTMFDALAPAAAALAKGSAESGAAAAAIAGTVADAAAAGAAATAHMAPGAGRSSYLASALLEGHADPGAVLAATWMQAVATLVRGA